MASPVSALLCALIATGFWTLLGYALARHLLPRALALGAASVLGWAAHSAAVLPVYFWIGLSSTNVFAIAAICILGAGFSLSLRVGHSDARTEPSIPPWMIVGAAVLAGVLALAPAAAIVPKHYGDAVQLADPIFDHAKIAFIDSMARLGVPPVNPVFGEFGAPGRLAYYYLWHFSAAELALVARATGWEADIALTWFTAFASLNLMMGLAVWLGKRSAAIWVAALATAGSIWATIYWMAGTDDLRPVLWPPIGMAGWLFQASWVPQHLMSASCVVLAMLLLARYARRQNLTLVLTLALVIVAGFESSTFVGGVTFAIAGLIAAPILFAAAAPARRLNFIAGLALAALLVVCLIAPFILDQLSAVRARNGGVPIVASHYAVFGEYFPHLIRRILDVPGFWLLIVPAELPATFFAGVIGLFVLWRSALPAPKKLAVAVLACLAGASLAVSWLLVSTLGDNNDLGLRAFIPAVMVLIVGVAAAVGSTAATRLRATVAAMALIGLVLGAPDAVQIFRDNALGLQRPDEKEFAQSPELWAAVRRHATPAARVANNPLFVKDVTPWPINISWALLADRSSCFAGIDMALAFAPLPVERRQAIGAQFLRVFGGEAAPGDVRDMAENYGCDVAVVVPTDGAWKNDPFAASSDYRLAEAREDRWRIYVRATTPPIRSPQTN